jgi:hypothetical protein
LFFGDVIEVEGAGLCNGRKKQLVRHVYQICGSLVFDSAFQIISDFLLLTFCKLEAPKDSTTPALHRAVADAFPFVG